MATLSVCLYCILQTTALLVVANGAPLLANKMLDNRWSYPVDSRLKLRDGRPLLGSTKTWRGVFAAVLFTSLAGSLNGTGYLTGALFGLLAMTGDLLASFIKRRMSRAESSRARGLDTVPESLLPIVLLKGPLTLDILDIFLIVGIFFLIEEWGSPVLYRLHIRKRPY